MAVSIIFMKIVMPWYIFIFSLAEVIVFFYFSNSLIKKWSNSSSKKFLKQLFITALIIRVVWVIFSYYFYLLMNGEPFEFFAGDAHFYDGMAQNLADHGFSAYNSIFNGIDISDRGYATYLGVLYMIFGRSLFISRLIKALFSAWTVVLVYRIASRTFGESTGRMAAIFTMLMPNLIWYCGLQLKESEMVFLVIAFIERTDFMLRYHQYSFVNVFIALLISIVLFTFRTVLGLTALFSMMMALLLARQKLMGLGHRFIIGVVVVLTVSYFAGGRIVTQMEELWQVRHQAQQQNMEWRSQREGGNRFADKAKFAVFAPTIFVIPIPTMVGIPEHINQELINGGNFDKEIMAFFVIVALIWIIREKKWRDFSLIGSFLVGYQIILAMSSFAQSERFHQPSLPFVMMFAAYGISKVTNKSKRFYNLYLVALFFAIIAWNWFKLAGRDIV